MSKALLYDSTVCIGCKQCEQACASQNDLPYDDTIASEEFQSAHKMTVVLTRGDKFMRRLCMNCADPSCASVCPVGALQEDRARPGYLRRFQVHGMPLLHGCLPLRRSQVRVGQAVAQGAEMHHVPRPRCRRESQTACAEICPTGATKFGERDELIAEAQKRIHDNPGNYVDHIYGLEEVGGTSVLLLSAVPFETFGYRTNLTKDPLPDAHLPGAVAHSRLRSSWAEWCSAAFGGSRIVAKRSR